jgi:hypothetical protein
LTIAQVAVGKGFADCPVSSRQRFLQKNQKTRKSLPTTTLGSRQRIFVPKKIKK